MRPPQAKLLLSAISHGIVCQSEGGIPSTCTMWYSLGTALTALTARHTVWEATEISRIGGRPSEGSSPLKSSRCS